MEWPDHYQLLDLNRRDGLLLQHAFENVMVLGPTGSGKSSGPLQHMVRAGLSAGFGVVLLSVKADAVPSYLRWAMQAGRGKDVVRFGPKHNARFNILDYIPRKFPGETFLVVEEVLLVLTEALTLIKRNQDEPQTRGKDDGFFLEAARDLLRLAILALLLSGEPLTMPNLARFVSEAPRHLDDSRAARDNFAVRVVTQARNRLRREGREHLAAQVQRFITVDWAGSAHDTREGIRKTAQVLFAVLTYEPAATLFGTDTTVSPDDVLDGKVLIVEPPIHEQRALGSLSAAIWKAMVQRAILARDMGSDPKRVRPVLIVADEAHELVTSSDVRFVSSSRSQRGISCYATQTVSSLTETLGENATNTLLGGFRNRFICRTDDPGTLRWLKESVNEFIDDSVKPSQTRRVVDQATDGLRSLRQGGSDGVVEAVFVRGGDRLKATGRRWCRVRFRQNPPRSWWRRLWQYLTTNEVQISPRERR